ncbi:MAG: DEAD/DEAH box helicase [Caldilineaceae bacterium]
MTFEEFNLDARLLARVKAVGYVAPTPIQEQAIPRSWTAVMFWAWRKPAPAKQPPLCCPSCTG